MRALIAIAACCLLLVPAAGAAPERVAFPYGVGAFDPAHDAVTFWTATDRPARLRVDVSADSSFRGRLGPPRWTQTSEASGMTASVRVPVPAATRVWYRFVAPPSVSRTGTVLTPPAPDVSASLKLVYAGDWDATSDPATGVPGKGRFEIFDRVAEERPDLFAAIGDTIYADSDLNDLYGIPDAYTREQYRDKYRESLALTSADGTRRPLADVRSGSGTVAIWDDHEVQNDYSGLTADPVQLVNGQMAFLEFWPVPTDDVLYRTRRWGSDVELFILDERSFRSEEAIAACAGDLAPMLPAGLRTLAGLPPAPPPGCLEALDDPSRTLLGHAQLAWLKDRLARSTARWKLILNEDPVAQLYGLPYDRWEGFAAERTDLLTFIATRPVTGVVWLTTDLHANLIMPVFLDKLTLPLVAGREFVNGPVQTTPLLPELVSLLGQDGAQGFVTLLTSLVGPSCANLDTFSYGLVEYDRASGALTVSYRDATGGTVPNAYPGVPLSVDPCRVTLPAP